MGYTTIKKLHEILDKKCNIKSKKVKGYKT